MNKMTEILRPCLSLRRWMVILVFCLMSVTGYADPRNICLLPLAADQPIKAMDGGVFPALRGSEGNPGWSAYMQVWQAHHQDPANLDVRRFLGLPTSEPFAFQAKRGRTSPRWLGWQPGTFAQVETSHFSIYSTADEATTRRVAEDLERSFWAWTQLFFPLWEAAAQVTAAFSAQSPDQTTVGFLSSNRPRLTSRRQFQVVLLKNVEQYRKTLEAEGSGIEQSTGFYSDTLRTIFLYGSDDDAAETRRHELTHQLFREATRSSLGQTTPGERTDFWLVEGIAGYMESMTVGERVATIGGWDASRLQYARYRVLAGGDLMPPAELMSDGHQQAQQRSDLVRWYSHSIAHVHTLMDGGNDQARSWLYQRLSSLYRSRSPMPLLKDRDAIESRILRSWGQDLQRYLQLNDKQLSENPPSDPLRVLCLNGCEVTKDGLEFIPASREMTWLDLARLPVGNLSVKRLIPEPTMLEQLTLEVTKVDDSLGSWVRQARRLRELDMSWTVVGDEFLQSIAGFEDLSVLWMTGTRLTDE
ncbi:MAG: hypothetical protein ACPHL6_09455, partial [Rubripirellula sp.]